MKKTLILVVLDGWGIGRNDETNPVYITNPKNFAWLNENFPVTSLQASGIAVGLPWGEVGNSEVGHLTLGAGKILYQYYPKITMMIQDKTFFSNPTLKDAFAHARKNNSAINFVGLLSKGNVHASVEHVQALLKMAELEKIGNAQLHLFADGKDTPPHTLETFLRDIPKEKIATLAGRYYGMDRNRNWALTQIAYENLTGQSGMIVTDAHPTIEETYKRGLTEEYLPPRRIGKDKIIRENDAIVFFNFREDSIRQLAESFIMPGFEEFPTKDFKNVYIATMTQYEERFAVPVICRMENVLSPLGKVLSDAGKNQLRLAETYKYAHVTFFFNGYQEAPFPNEYRIVIPSISTARVEDHPEMMAGPITDRLIDAIESHGFDFILVNYANPDTIAHSANYEAGLRTVETIDKELGRILKVAINPETVLVITSDHGNIEEMINPTTGVSESQHDPNPVPFYLIAPEFEGKKFANWKNLSSETMGSIADVAPTILELMEIRKPPEMTGRSLLEGIL